MLERGHAAAGSYLGMLPAHLQMLSAALLLCLCSSSASPASREMRWMEDGAGRKLSVLLRRNDGVCVRVCLGGAMGQRKAIVNTRKTRTRKN